MIIDVSDPYHPVEIANYDTPGYAREVEVSLPYLYVADSEGGIIALKVKNNK